MAAWASIAMDRAAVASTSISMPGRASLGTGISVQAGKRGRLSPGSPLPQCSHGALPVLEALQRMIDDKHGELEHMAHVRATGGQGGPDVGKSLRSLQGKAVWQLGQGVFSALARDEEPAQRLLNGDHMGVAIGQAVVETGGLQIARLR